MATGRKPPKSRKQQERAAIAATRRQIAQDALQSVNQAFPIPTAPQPPVPGVGTGSCTSHRGSTIVHLDPERARKCAAMVLSGSTDADIVRELHLDRSSIPGILQGLEDQGLLQPISKRINAIVARLAETTAYGSLIASEVMVKDLYSPDDPKAITARAATGKTLGFLFSVSNSANQLATGQPTEIVEHRARPAADDWRSWVRAQSIDAEVIPSPPDSQSGEIPRLAEHSEQDEPDDTLDDTYEPEQEPADAGLADGAGGGARA